MNNLIDALEWSPVAILPNIEVKSSIGNEYALLVSANDPRISALASKFPNVAEFAGRFEDVYGHEAVPSYVIFHQRFRRRHTDGDALVAFRDLVAMSSILPARSQQLVGALTWGRPAYSDSFDFCPWMLDTNLSEISIRSGGVLGSQLTSTFYGQASPQVPHTELEQTHMDRFLSAKLMDEWTTCFVQRKRVAAGRRLFRSLQMAFHALRVPSGYYTSKLDLGRLISLFVSAHEILVHNGHANQTLVLSELKKYKPCTPALRTKNYRWPLKKKPSLHVTALEKACMHLYEARNDFLHGNPITNRSLTPRGYAGNI